MSLLAPNTLKNYSELLVSLLVGELISTANHNAVSMIVRLTIDYIALKNHIIYGLT